MSVVEAAIDYARSRKTAHVDALKEFLAIPSISTLPAHREDVERAAQWLADQLLELGLTRVEIMPTGGLPAVYGEWLGAPGRPVVLVYGHYDVQPVDPLNDWDTDPFQPTIRGDDLYARGASDMKSQIFGQFKAVEALSKQGPLPTNIKYLLEGEEEVGSPHLGEFIDAHRDLLTCDVVLNCDSGILGPDRPAIVYALRGLAYFEIELRGPKKDLHSGVFGGSIHNPAQALCELIAGMHDSDGRVTLPGYYAKVQRLTDAEREALACLPFSDDEWKEMTGAPALWGEKGYTTAERIGARPTLEVNGLVSGFTGEGSKTVLPATALAKISMRLVPDQEPAEIYDQLCEYMRRNAPESIAWEVRELVHSPGAVMDRDSPAMKAAVTALEQAFGVKPVFRREGGSVPVVGLLQQKLGVDTVMLGFALPDDGVHGPNEKQHLPCFYKGIETYIRFLAAL